MTSLKTLLLAGTACTLMASPALAQSSTTPEKTPASQQAPEQPTSKTEEQEEPEASKVEDIEVRTTSSTPRTSIDSISYSLADDLQTTSGTLADALRNVPSVDVDTEGKVSLRGNSSVTILIDGRPAPMFDGPSRGQIIQQIPADQYARIEVMTNPSAAFSAEGSGGIINLISKPNAPKPGTNTLGSIRANIGDERYNIGANIVHTRDKLTLTGDIGIRNDVYIVSSLSERIQRDPVTGQTLTSRESAANDGPSDSVFVRGSVDYRLDPKTQITANAWFSDVNAGGTGGSIYEQVNDQNQVVRAYSRQGSGGFEGKFGGGSVRLLRSFNDSGHEWSNEIRLNHHSTLFSSNTRRDFQVPVTPSQFDHSSNDTAQTQWGFTSAYVLPKADGSKLRAGYELNHTSLELDNLLKQGDSADNLTPNPLVSNRFDMDRTVHALYATYEKPLGEKLSGQLGLRLEQSYQELDQVTSGDKIKSDDFAAYPTLHLSYQLTDTQSVKGSYSRRIQRPQPEQLNPFLVYGDPQNYSSGNPDLVPQETDSFELLWQGRIKQSFYQATLFYRDTQNAFTSITSDMGNGIFLSRPENVGSSSSKGIELVANGALHPKLRYNASVNLSQIEYGANSLAGTQGRKGENLTSRLSLNWQPTAKDFVQLSGVWMGNQVTPQGETEMQPLYNLGYRHKFNNDWSLQLTARDLLDEFGSKSFIETPYFSTRNESTFGGRTVFIGLTWNFGKGQRRPEQFDFSAAPSGG